MQGSKYRWVFRDENTDEPACVLVTDDFDNLWTALVSIQPELEEKGLYLPGMRRDYSTSKEEIDIWIAFELCPIFVITLENEDEETHTRKYKLKSINSR